MHAFLLFFEKSLTLMAHLFLLNLVLDSGSSPQVSVVFLLLHCSSHPILSIPPLVNSH
ncbi:hypothetical protein AAZX31_04G197700 [Glycine max]